jgi:hypothetical protein
MYIVITTILRLGDGAGVDSISVMLEIKAYFQKD